MAAEILRVLVMGTVASSVGMLLVGLLRDPLRRAAGARAAYWLWLLVPALTLAVLIPAPSQMLLPPTAALPAQMHSLLTVAVAGVPSRGEWWIDGVILVWLVGAVAMLFALLSRQRAFSRSLGSPVRDARGWFRGGVNAPMLVGAFHPRIIVPEDFETRYTSEEQALVLAHEAAHADRHDVVVNALASFVLCASWFNPLAYRALAWLRLDQELACDAVVLTRQARFADAGVRRVYAEALLKTQLAAESAWRMPLVCKWGSHWQPNHPLKERILMIKQPLPGSGRRFAGITLVLGITAITGYAAWAGQAATPDKGPPVLVDLKVTITNPQTNEVNVLATRYLVHSGEDINEAGSQSLKYACTPYLPDGDGLTTDWTAIRARGIPTPPPGHILVLCSIREAGQEVASPAVMMADGKPGTIETSQKEGPLRYRLEINASTSAARIAEAARDADKR